MIVVGSLFYLEKSNIEQLMPVRSKRDIFHEGIVSWEPSPDRFPNMIHGTLKVILELLVFTNKIT